MQTLKTIKSDIRKVFFQQELPLLEMQDCALDRTAVRI